MTNVFMAKYLGVIAIFIFSASCAIHRTEIVTSIVEDF